MTIIKSDAPTSPAAKITGVNDQYELIIVPCSPSFIWWAHKWSSLCEGSAWREGHLSRWQRGRYGREQGGERVRPGSHQGASVVCPTTTMPPWPSQDATAMSLQCYFMPQLQWCDTYLLTNMCCLIQITIGLLTKNHFDSCRREASKNYLANFVR